MTRPVGLAHHPRLEQPIPLAGATASFLPQRDLRSRSSTVYGQTLARLARYADPDTPLAQLGPANLQAFMDTWYAGAATATWNLNLAALRSFYRYALRQHLVAGDPSAAIERRRLRRDPDRRVIPARQLESLWHQADLPVREKTLWRLLYDTAARADEILGLDIGDLDLQNKTATVTGKGGIPRQVNWYTHTAHLLPPDNRRTDQGTTVPHQPPTPPTGRHPRPRHRPGTLVLPAGRRMLHHDHRLDTPPATPHPDPGTERRQLPATRAAKDHRAPLTTHPDRALPRTQPQDKQGLVRKHGPGRSASTRKPSASPAPHGFSRSPDRRAMARALVT
jgi:integrase